MLYYVIIHSSLTSLHPFFHARTGWTVAYQQTCSESDCPFYFTTDVLAGFPNSLIDANNSHPQNFEDSYIGVVVGAAVAFVVIISVVVVIIVFRQKRRKYGRTVLESVLSPDRLSFKLQSAPVSTSGKISNGNIYKSIATNEAGDCEKEGLSLKMSTFPARETLKQLPEDSLPIYELPHTIDYNCPGW